MRDSNKCQGYQEKEGSGEEGTPKSTPFRDELAAERDRLWELLDAAQRVEVLKLIRRKVLLRQFPTDRSGLRKK